MLNRRMMFLAALFAGCLAFVGCGPSAVSVEGKVTNGTQGYSPSADGELSISLQAADGKGSAYTGKAEEDGSFKIKAPDGGGVPTGKYAVTVVKYPKSAEKDKKGSMPMPSNMKVPEEWEVNSGSKSFTIDVTKLKSK